MRRHLNIKHQTFFAYDDSPEMLERTWLKCYAKYPWPFYPWLVEETRRRQATAYNEQFCRYLIIVVMLEGKLRCKCEDKPYKLAPGDILLIPPGTSYSFDSRPSCFYHKLVIEYRGYNLLSILETMKLDRIQYYHAHEKYSSVLDRIRACAQLMEPNTTANLSEILAISYAILADCATMAQHQPKAKGNMAELQRRLENQLSEPLTMKQLAKEFNLNVMQMTRNFQKKFKVTPKVYRDTCRMEHALDLLTETTLSIKEIAYQVGCRDQFQFSRQFRLYRGCSPTQHRKIIQQQRQQQEQEQQ